MTSYPPDEPVGDKQEEQKKSKARERLEFVLIAALIIGGLILYSYYSDSEDTSGGCDGEWSAEIADVDRFGNPVYESRCVQEPWDDSWPYPQGP